MSSRKSSQVKPRIAVIGAGLAGLSAAYHLRDTARVTVLEKEARIGGRILTSQRPWGEHGAQFFLSRENEPTIHQLVDDLGLELIEWLDEPGYLLKGRFAEGSPVDAAQQLLSPDSAKRVRRLLEIVKKETRRNSRAKLDRWLSDFLEKDRTAITFVGLLLAGEICAPASHIKARYGLECLSSLYDDWYSIRGEAKELVKALAQSSPARFLLRAQVKEVKEIHEGVCVRWTGQQGNKSEIFEAVIIGTPDGERLIGMPAPNHFHAYISVLLDYQGCPRLKANPDFDLSRGLYTDGPLNYIQLTTRRESYVLRILIPNADTKLRWKERDLFAYCVDHLRPLLIGDSHPHCSSIKIWKLGLPCGGDAKGSRFRKVSQRVFLAGDRFGKWPSMDAAIRSGHLAARASVLELPGI